MHDEKLSNLFKDRVKVYQILNDNKIETPRYIVCDRSDLENMPEFEEFDDYLEINGETFHKPFVEKPVRYDQNYFYQFSGSISPNEIQDGRLSCSVYK